MITENVLKEWYTENASRRFPLATLVPEGAVIPTGLDNAGQVLPNSLLIGIQMIVPRTMLAARPAGSTYPYDSLADNYRIYLSSVVITLDKVEIVFSTKSGKNVAKAVWSPSLELQGLPVHGVQIAPIPVTDDDNIGTNKISGFVFLGPDSMWKASAGVYMYSGDNIYNSMVSESCIGVDADDHVTGIIVDGERMTGDITIVAGDNVHLDVDTTNNILTVSFAADQIDGIHNVSELIESVSEVYGEPIVSINNIKPDINGDFTIESPDGTVGITELDNGIALQSSTGEECCDKSALDPLLENVQALNEKFGREDTFLKSVEENVNALQNELSYLKMTALQ